MFQLEKAKLKAKLFDKINYLVYIHLLEQNDLTMENIALKHTLNMGHIGQIKDTHG